MKRPPPVTILEFLERLGCRFGIDLYGNVSELYPRELMCVAPIVREALPIIRRELETRQRLSRRGAKASETPALGPRLNSTRVTNIFRGINLLEAFVGDAHWVQIGFAKRERDGKKVAAQRLAQLAIVAEPNSE